MATIAEISKALMEEIEKKEKFDFRGYLLQRCKQEWSKVRPDIHMSRLSLCLRAECFDAQAGKVNVNERKIKYFLNGQFQHENLQSILGEDFETEKEIKFNGVVGHVDIYIKSLNIPIEVKTTESAIVCNNYKEHNAEQLRDYMAVLGSPYGIIFYIIMGQFNVSTFFPQYYIEMTDDERKKRLTSLIDRAANLQKGIILGRPENVWHSAYNENFFSWRKITEREPDGKLVKVSRKINWLCDSCDHKKECYEMRVKSGEEPR